MADKDASKKERIPEDDVSSEDEAQHICSPEQTTCRHEAPKLGKKQPAVRPPRTTKAAMPFADEMTDEAMEEFRKRFEADCGVHETHSITRTA